MLIRLALILGLVLQPFLVLGGAPCADRQPDAAIASMTESCCCPAAAPQATCDAPSACGCAPLDDPGTRDDTTPPGASAERLLTIALLADLAEVRPLAGARTTAPNSAVLPAFTGGSAQALFCVWRT